jgi:hypothetical protein
MSLLLDLLEATYDLYKKMEDIRPGSLLNSLINNLIPSFSSVGLTMKAPILKALHDSHLKIMMQAKSSSPELDRNLAKAILDIKYPGTENKPIKEHPKHTSASASSSTGDASEMKNEPHKFDIVSEILKAGAHFVYGNITKEAAANTIDGLLPTLEKAFANIEGVDVYFFKVKEFLRQAADLKENEMLKQRFLDTEIEAGKKTRRITALEEEIRQTKAASKTADDTQTEKILELQTKLFRAPNGATTTVVVDLNAALDANQKLAQKLKVAESEKAALIKQASDRISLLEKTLRAERQKNAAQAQAQTSAETPTTKPTNPAGLVSGIPASFSMSRMVSNLSGLGMGSGKPSTMFNHSIVVNGRNGTLHTAASTTQAASTPTVQSTTPKPGQGNSY